MGLLYPDGASKLAKTDDVDQVRSIVECYPVRNLLNLLGIQRVL